MLTGFLTNAVSDSFDDKFASDESERESPFVPGKGRNNDPKFVMVVDDEDRVADSVAEILNDNGYQAVTAYNGVTAIVMARQRCPDVLVCDVSMPRLNGVETARAVQEVCPKTRVLLFSGQASSQAIVQRAVADGHEFEFLQKPFHPTALLKILGS
jgi:DNA-binding NtrC family response regulator